MDLKTFQHIVYKEEKAKRFFLRRRWKNGRKTCPHCEHVGVVRVRRQRLLCPGCRYEFSDFTGTYLSLLRIEFREWLWLLKLFDLEVSARKVARQMGLSYPTVLKGFQVIRQAIAAQDRDFPLLKGEVEADEAYFGGRRKGKRGRGAAGKVPVFGNLERAGKVRVEVVPNVKAETLLSLAVKKVRRGSIVYTDKYQSYDSLMCCGFRHLKVDHSQYFASGKVYINGLEGFWSYAKEGSLNSMASLRKNFLFTLKRWSSGIIIARRTIFSISLLNT